MQDDVDGVGARDLGDEREEPVPERERIAGVEAAVGELVRAREREVVEGQELLDASEVEEPVAADVPGDVPERDAEGGARREHRAAARYAHVRHRPADGERQRDEARRQGRGGA